jgi:signal transduction histidine kinase/CheY-like chemotaxis protein
MTIKEKQLSDIAVALCLVLLVWLIGMPLSISLGLTVLILLVVARSREIEASKFMQQGLLQERRVAEDANRAKSAFLANMSHEIRTPLNGVLGTIGLVLDSRLDPQQREYLSLARTSAAALLEIVNDILDFSKIEAGGVELAHIPFSLDQSLGDSLKLMSHRAMEKNISFEFEDETGLECALLGDPGRLRQIVINLVGNAIKFTQRGSVRLRVTATERAAHSVRLHFSVRDTGIGISPGQLQRLFQSFVQADSSTARVYGGTGLGLAISKGLVEAMQGRIGVQSEPGVGSEFFFDLHFPLDLSMSTRPADLQAAAPPPVLRSLNLLVVEDNTINRLVASRLLSKRGHRVNEAATALAGLEAVQRDQPDLVLMDLQLPGMGGLEALALLRQLPGRARYTPVIALTAHVLIGDRERCLAAGMNGYVSKPFTADSLFKEISRVLAECPPLAPLPHPPVVTTMPGAVHPRFVRALEGLSGDTELFIEVAAVAIAEFGFAATRLEALVEAKDLKGLAGLAHQLASNWALYAERTQENLPAHLTAAARAGDFERASMLAEAFSAALRGAAGALSQWLAERETVDIALDIA